MHHLLLASLSVRSPQVLRLRDATTGQQVSLVGTVHYNPASVARAKEEVALASKRDRSLGAVVVESCTSRWTTSLEKAPPGSLIANLVCSEMQGAAGVALQKGVPIMLGDADAGAFLPRVRQLAQQSVRDLVSPFAGGWAAIVQDFGRTLPGTLNPADVASSELLLEGERPIGIQDFLKPEMLVGFLFSLIRYPAAFALKAPLPFAALAAFLYALESTAIELDAATASSVAAGEVVSLPIVAALLFSAATTGLSVRSRLSLQVAHTRTHRALQGAARAGPTGWVAAGRPACGPQSDRAGAKQPSAALAHFARAIHMTGQRTPPPPAHTPQLARPLACAAKGSGG